MKYNMHAKTKTHFPVSVVIALLASVLAVSVLSEGHATKSASTTIKGPPDRELLETTHEACGKDKLVFNAGAGKKITIHYGQSASFANNMYPLVWYCGASEKEHTRCPTGTNFVEVVRSQGRDFTVRCFQDSALFSREPIKLEETEEACSEQILTVVGRDGDVKIGYAKSKEFPVTNSDIIWYCGASRERTGCHGGTNYLKVSRSGGRKFTVGCYQVQSGPNP
jgi:hypothetical protein